MLSNWSSPFPHEETQMNIVKAKNRPKLTSYKQLDTEEDELGDYTPKKDKDKEKEKEKENEKVKVKVNQREKETYVDEKEQEPMYNKPFEFESYKPQDTVLLEKLNYMIYLLEEQRDEKTGQVTEELILYVFLGVFVLFVLDSFFKTGKYSR